MTTTHAQPQSSASPPPAPAEDDLGRAMPPLAWDDGPAAAEAAFASGYYRASAGTLGEGGPRTDGPAASRHARRLLADLIEAARDAESLAAALESRDLTAAEAAAVLAAERPGLPFRLMETATEVCGFPAHVGAESGRTCSACVHPACGGMRSFHGAAWRAVVADVLAAFGTEGEGQ